MHIAHTIVIIIIESIKNSILRCGLSDVSLTATSLDEEIKISKKHKVHFQCDIPQIHSH